MNRYFDPPYEFTMAEARAIFAAQQTDIELTPNSRIVDHAR
ncbi:hypothetical protein BRAO375_2610002 [Bradyrhizobium sp. ORS 375]|nr:hypothetical protein BRAO375_2610002 [Bradyrhizobium sp. ORS 375]